MSWISRLVNALRSERVASDLDEELRFHFEERVDELVRGGMPRRDAERAARLKFGGALQVRESTASTRPCCCNRRSTAISGPPVSDQVTATRYG